MFGNLFKKKKKVEEKYSGDLTVNDLKKGFFIDYFMKSWEITDEFEYDWGNNFSSKEFRLDAGDERMYMSVEDDDELKISISKKVPMTQVNPDLKAFIIEMDEPMKSFEYKGKKFYLSEESQGHYRNVEDGDGDDSWSAFVMWDFLDEKEEEFISISRWTEQNIEAFEGSYVGDYEFSNIIPVLKEEE